MIYKLGAFTRGKQATRNPLCLKKENTIEALNFENNNVYFKKIRKRVQHILKLKYAF